MWDDAKIWLTCATAFVGGGFAGWFTRRSVLRGLTGCAAAVFVSAGLMFIPEAISAFRLWRYIPQEVSLPQEMLLAGIIPFPLATIFVGIGWFIGFTQYWRCRE